MERRRALVVAGTMTATLAMAGTAMAVNMGLLGSDSDPVGDLTATEIQPAPQRASDRTPANQKPRVRVIVQDIPVAAGGSGGGTSTGTVESSGGSTPAPAPAPAPSGDDDDGYDDSDDDHGYDDDDDDDGGSDDSDDHDDDDSDDGIDEPDDDD